MKSLQPSSPTEQEILNYAKHLGIDIVNDKHLLYIAKEALQAPLPKTWKEFEINGELHYINILTKETSKDHPLDHLYRKHYNELKGFKFYENKENISNNDNFLKESVENIDRGSVNESYIKNLAVDYQKKLKEYEQYKYNELKKKEKNMKKTIFLEENQQKNYMDLKEMEISNNEVEEIKLIRKKEFEERKKILKNRINLLEMKKSQLIKIKEKNMSEIEGSMQLEKIKLEEDFQEKISEIHIKLMNQFSNRMNNFMIDCQRKLDAKRREILDKNINERKQILMPYYDELFQRRTQEIERKYQEYYKNYEDNEMIKVEEIAMNEHQKEKFSIIQSKINEINQERLKMDQEINEKMNIYNNYKMMENEKIAKIKELKQIIASITKNLNKNPEECKSMISEYENIVDDLNAKINKLNDENQLLQIELISLTNQLEDEELMIQMKNQENCNIQAKKNQASELSQTLEKLDQEITVLKQKSQDSQNVSFADTTVNKPNSYNNENSINLSNIEKNYSAEGFVKVPLKLLKKSQFHEKSFISIKNDDSYLSDIQDNDNNNSKSKKNSRNSVKNQINSSNRCEITQNKHQNSFISKKVFKIKKDWNQILSLEKEKLKLFIDNLKKEKVIFENRNKEEDWITKNTSQNHQNLHEIYIKYIRNHRKSLVEELIQLKTSEKLIGKKANSLKNLEKLYFSLSSNEKEDSLMDRAYKDYKQLESEIQPKSSEILNISDLNSSDDIPFYQCWIEILQNKENFNENQLSPYKFEEDSLSNQSKEEFNCNYNTKYSHNLNLSMDQGRKINKNRINTSFHLENRMTTIVQSNYSRSSKEIMRNMLKEREKVDNLFSKHTNWMNSVKNQLSTNYYNKPYDSVVKRYSTSPYLKKL